LPSHIDVDGVKRPTTNNKGEQIHQTEEGVRNFWKWFGDSNTVDNQGRPVIHYHGTQSQSEIDSFRSPSSAAHWASPSPELASKYGRGNSVYPIYVKSHTPFNTRKFSDGDYADIDRFKANLSKQAPISDKDTISHLSNMVDHGDDVGLTHKSWSSSEGIESYKKLGFDSIHHTEDGAHTVGVFHPNQIKSVIGNTGKFSTQSHSINESTEHPMIDVDGEMKHRHNSEGKPIHHTDEGIRNFHRWFGDSKAVDEHGRPKVFNHTTTVDWDSFDMSKASSSAVWGKGIYLSPNDKWRPSGQNNIIKKLYVKLHNPIDLTKPLNDESRNKISNYIGRSVETIPLISLEKRAGSVGNGLKGAGFDGIIHEGPGSSGTHLMVFDSHQIKSALGNTGEFKHDTSNINESIEHPMIDVDGEMKHRHNSNGQPIHHTDEGIRNFHKWFDKSKAVDEHGRPQVFYHGTTHNFKSFDPSKSGQKDHGWYGVGHYFTPDVYTASAYSTYDVHNTTGANVMPVYLKIHNPYKWTQDIQPKKTQEESAEATMNMRNLGYDGVFVENKFATPGHEKFYEAIAFQPHQIKSVSGNTGEFKQGTTNITESADNPDEAIVGNLKTMQDSGRYKITHKGYNDRYDSHDFIVTAHPPRNAVSFYHQKGRDEQSWYNPDMAEIHTPYPEDPYPRTYPRLKASSGYRQDIDDQKTHGVLYRGMSHEEFNNIKKTGLIKSHGDYNLEGQEGLTYYSRDPSQAAHYAHGFAPAQHKASGKHNVYVVAVKDPGTDVKVSGTGEDEVGIPHPISVDDILHVHVGKAYASHPGTHTMVKDWSSKYSDGSGSHPNTYIGWKKKEFNEL